MNCETRVPIPFFEKIALTCRGARVSFRRPSKSEKASQLHDCTLPIPRTFPGDRIETRETHRAGEMMFGICHPLSYCCCQRCGSLWLAEPPDPLNP